MGDAYTHLAQDRRRADAIADWIDMLFEYLSSPTEARRAYALKAAEEADAILGHGYFSAPTDIATHAASMLDALRTGDEASWRQLLTRLAGDERVYTWQDFRRFKKLSPYASRRLVFVTVYPNTSIVRLSADPKEFVSYEGLDLQREENGKGGHETSVHLLELDLVDDPVLLPLVK